MVEFDRTTAWLNVFPILRLLEWDAYGDELTELFKSYPNFTPASFLWDVRPKDYINEQSSEGWRKQYVAITAIFGAYERNHALYTTWSMSY